MKKVRRYSGHDMKWSGNDFVSLADVKKHLMGQTSEAEENEKYPIQNVNPHLKSFQDDYLYHLNMSKSQCDLKEMFGDVKFICMGGTPKRMLQFSHFIKSIVGYKMPTGHIFENITESTDRYSMYKCGPILSVNHGIGCPSISIILNELLKLIVYAGCKDVTFFRLGTSGGIGLKPGTLVISDEAVDGMFRPEYRQIILGKEVIRASKLNADVAQELLEIGLLLKENGADTFEGVTIGKTLCAHDFYEGQGRVDGIFCDHTVEEKMQFLNKCKELQVKNIEMESLAFAGFCHYANVKSAVVCVTLVDRLNGDQVEISHETNLKFQERPFRLVGEYIKKHLNANGNGNAKTNGKE